MPPASRNFIEKKATAAMRIHGMMPTVKLPKSEPLSVTAVGTGVTFNTSARSNSVKGKIRTEGIKYSLRRHIDFWV